ncbi:MAG: RAD55 family ATPase [Thermoplasmata archaeon]
MFPEKYSVIVVGAPEAGVLEFCAYLASFYLKNGQDVVMVETDTSADFVRRMISEFGVTREVFEKAAMTTIDCYSEPKEENDLIRYAELSDLPGLLEKVKSAIEELQEPVRVIFDSLSSLFIHNAAEDITGFLEKLIRLSKERGSLTATLYEKMHPAEQVVALTSQCDGLIEMMVDEQMERYIRIKRMKDLPVKPNWVPFEPGLSERVSGTSLIWKK